MEKLREEAPRKLGVMKSHEDSLTSTVSGVHRLALLGTVISIGSLLTSLVLLVLYREMGGPGDQVVYYEQAISLIPFNHVYGPIYFLTIRVIHDLFGLDWFLVGKITSWVSAAVFLGLCYSLFRRLIGPTEAWLGLALVAMNPVFIGESYDALTVMFGASVVLSAVLLMAGVNAERSLQWSLPGLVFGFAYLTRFQALGLFMGALAGILFIRGISVSKKVHGLTVLFLSAALPVLAWNLFLLSTQGYLPETRAHTHLALAFENFGSWTETNKLTKYGSTWGLLTSHWTAPLQLVAFAAKNTIKFPFTIGYELFFIGAGWLIPGAIVAFTRRDAHWPSLMALSAGLVTTGIGSMGWVHYYVPFIPLGVLFIANAIQALSGSNTVRLISWVLVLASTLAWSPSAVRTTFLNTNWPEFTTAREYIEAHRDPKTVVSTTAASFRYGTKVPFVDLDNILRPEESKKVASRLRERGVTHLIITERHTLYNFPDFKYLLDDHLDHPPEGLKRELLIREPRRLAIYRVIPQ